MLLPLVQKAIRDQRNMVIIDKLRVFHSQQGNITLVRAQTVKRWDREEEENNCILLSVYVYQVTSHPGSVIILGKQFLPPIHWLTNIYPALV